MKRPDPGLNRAAGLWPRAGCLRAVPVRSAARSPRRGRRSPPQRRRGAARPPSDCSAVRGRVPSSVGPGVLLHSRSGAHGVRRPTRQRCVGTADNVRSARRQDALARCALSIPWASEKRTLDSAGAPCSGRGGAARESRTLPRLHARLAGGTGMPGRRLGACRPGGAHGDWWGSRRRGSSEDNAPAFQRCYRKWTLGSGSGAEAPAAQVRHPVLLGGGWGIRTADHPTARTRIGQASTVTDSGGPGRGCTPIGSAL